MQVYDNSFCYLKDPYKSQKIYSLPYMPLQDLDKLVMPLCGLVIHSQYNFLLIRDLKYYDDILNVYKSQKRFWSPCEDFYVPYKTKNRQNALQVKNQLWDNRFLL